MTEPRTVLCVDINAVHKHEATQDFFVTAELAAKAYKNIIPKNPTVCLERPLETDQTEGDYRKQAS